MAGLILTITLVAWSALGLRPPIPAATSSWPFVAILATVIISAVYLVWKVPQWQAATDRGLDLSDADLPLANLTNANHCVCEMCALRVARSRMQAQARTVPRGGTGE